MNATIAPLALRLTVSQRQLIEVAAARTGGTLSSFTREAALVAALRVVERVGQTSDSGPHEAVSPSVVPRRASLTPGRSRRAGAHARRPWLAHADESGASARGDVRHQRERADDSGVVPRSKAAAPACEDRPPAPGAPRRSLGAVDGHVKKHRTGWGARCGDCCWRGAARACAQDALRNSLSASKHVPRSPRLSDLVQPLRWGCPARNRNGGCEMVAITKSGHRRPVRPGPQNGDRLPRTAWWASVARTQGPAGVLGHRHRLRTRSTDSRSTAPTAGKRGAHARALRGTTSNDLNCGRLREMRGTTSNNIRCAGQQPEPEARASRSGSAWRTGKAPAAVPVSARCARQSRSRNRSPREPE